MLFLKWLGINQWASRQNLALNPNRFLQLACCTESLRTNASAPDEGAAKLPKGELSGIFDRESLQRCAGEYHLGMKDEHSAAVRRLERMQVFHRLYLQNGIAASMACMFITEVIALTLDNHGWHRSAFVAMKILKFHSSRAS